MTHTLNIDGHTFTFGANDDDVQAINEVITDLLTKDGFVNIDADDVKATVDGADNIAAGEGTASGEGRCGVAAREAMKGLTAAKKLLLAVRTGFGVTLTEMLDAAIAVQEVCDPDAEVIWGHVIDEDMDDSVKVSILAAI